MNRFAHPSFSSFYLPYLFLLAACLTGITLPAQQKGSWGDQGDGTYKNPILNANYPDIDIEKKGDTWYMISSTSTLVPGMTILESKDLVNWKLTGSVVPTISWRPDCNFDTMTGRGGVWAGDLAYHEGKWYCYFIDKWSGLYMTMTKGTDINGPWTPVTLMLKNTEWTDPAVFWDYEARQAYLICHRRTFLENEEKMFENKLYKMTWDGQKLLDTGKVVYTGPGAEAAKLHKINGYYYVLISEWLTAPHTGRDRKQLVLRSKDIYGPYERKVVLEKGNGYNRSACQGSLVQAPDSSWWFMHQLVQNKDSYEGRPQHLIPVRWENDWPIFGEDPDGNGVGNTVARHRKPVSGFPIVAPQTDDEFNTPKLSPQWMWHYNPDPRKWTLTERPGYLRLKATIPLEKDKLDKTPNVLLQRKMGKGHDVRTSKIELAGMQPLQEGGMVHLANYQYVLGVRIEAKGICKLFVDMNGTRQNVATLTAKTVWLRSTANADHVFFEYSTDGIHFMKAGEPFATKISGFDGDAIGFYTSHPAGKGYLDIDWFHYQYDGPKAKH